MLSWLLIPLNFPNLNHQLSVSPFAAPVPEVETAGAKVEALGLGFLFWGVKDLMVYISGVRVWDLGYMRFGV